MNYTDPNSYASRPGGLKLSMVKWKQIKDVYGKFFIKRFLINLQEDCIKHYIKYGDTQPAIVISANPLKVAVYSDEMDAVVILKYSEEFRKLYNFEKYTRLISVNIYQGGIIMKSDIHIGQGYLGRYINFFPTIGDFVSDDTETIKFHKENIPEDVWLHVQELAEEYITEYPTSTRKGFWFI